MFARLDLMDTEGRQNGYLVSRADLIGFTDEEIANPALVLQVRTSLEHAARELYYRPAEGSMH